MLGGGFLALLLHVLVLLTAPPGTYFSQAKPVGGRNAIGRATTESSSSEAASKSSVQIEKEEAASSSSVLLSRDESGMNDASAASASVTTEDLYVVKQNGSVEAVSFEKVCLCDTLTFTLFVI